MDFWFLRVRRQCWFCHAFCKVKRSEQKSWACKDCGQYNGFSEDGNYNREIPAMYDESLNTQHFCSGSDGKKSHHYNALCYSCNRNQELKMFQLSSFIPINEESYDKELSDLRVRLESSYRLCVFCEATVRDKLKLQDKWLENNLPKSDPPPVAEKKSLNLPDLRRHLNSVTLTAPYCIKMLFLNSALLGITIASVDLPCMMNDTILDGIFIMATLEAIRANLIALGCLGFLLVFGCLGLVSWKHQFKRTDFLLLMLWLSLITSMTLGNPDYQLRCTTTSYFQSVACLLISVVSMFSASANRTVVIREGRRKPKRSFSEQSGKVTEERAEKRMKSSSPTKPLALTDGRARPSPNSGTFSSPLSKQGSVLLKQGSPSSMSSRSSISPSDSASQLGGRERRRFGEGEHLPKPVKLFDRLDEGIDTGISSLKIGSPVKRNQYFVPSPTNFLTQTGSSATRSLFAGPKPVLSPPKFRPSARTNFWFGSIAQNKEFKDFSDFHKFNSSQPVSRSSSQSSGFVSCSDFTERTLVPEFGTPSPSLSRRSSVSDLTEACHLRGYSEQEQNYRHRNEPVSMQALTLARDARDQIGSNSRLSNHSQLEMKEGRWSWVPFILGFSVAINVCGVVYFSFLK